VLPKAAVGIDYDTALQAGAGTAPYSWSIISGSLPSGLSLTPDTGEISGTPTATGTNSFTVQVQDVNGYVATKTLLISVGSTVSGRAVSSSACSNNNPSISSLSCGVAYTDGNIVGCAISIAGNVQVSSVTDNASPANTYQQAAYFASSSGPRLEIWINNINSQLSATAVTVNLASGTQFSMSCDTLVGIDGWGLAWNGNPGTSTSPSVSVTTVDNNDWVLAGLAAEGSGLVTQMDVSDTTTGPTATDVGGGIKTVYQATAGSTSLNATLSTSESWLMYGIELSATEPPPTISTVTPTSGTPGTNVTVSGSYFLDAGSLGSVTMNGVVVAPTSWSDSSITFTVPANATNGPVSVAVGGNVSNAINFTVLLIPSIANLSTTWGAAGASVTITGTNFGASQSTSTVTFNGTTATVSSWSNNSIAVAVPSGATTGNVVVTESGIVSNGVAFTVLGPPTIASLSPTSGVVGQFVTITGSGFGAQQGESTVTFNGTTATVVSWSGASITVAVPSGATTGNVVVTVSGVASNGAAFTVVATLASGSSVSYTYDSQGRLYHVQYITPSGLVTVTYSYDSDGNRTSVVTQ
jgi:ribosomal protein L21E